MSNRSRGGFVIYETESVWTLDQKVLESISYPMEVTIVRGFNSVSPCKTATHLHPDRVDNANW